jgi:hypothetical protein
VRLESAGEGDVHPNWNVRLGIYMIFSGLDICIRET